MARRFMLPLAALIALTALAAQPGSAMAGLAAVALTPTTITGGSGASSTGTITLDAPAPAGGLVVALGSSNVELAASLPSITVPAGATSATFQVATNARFRRYSGLAFSVTISAVAGGVTRN